MTDPNGYGDHFLKRSVKGCSTVDITKTDNGYLNCARDGYRPSHADTSAAVDNILYYGPAGKSCAIIGHGKAGLIVTGTGQQAPNPKKYIATNNTGDWDHLLEKLDKKEMKNLYLFGCDVGGEKSGAKLLYKIATIVKVKVAAPAGIIFCSPFYFSLEDNSTWQVADHQSEPTPIPTPKSPVYVYTMNNILLYHKKSTLEIEKKDVVAAYVRQTTEDSWNKLTPVQLSKVFDSIDFSNPLDLRGIPSGLISWMLRLEYVMEKEMFTKDFDILNDRLVVDKEYPLIGYYFRPEEFI